MPGFHAVALPTRQGRSAQKVVITLRVMFLFITRSVMTTWKIGTKSSHHAPRDVSFHHAERDDYLEDHHAERDDYNLHPPQARGVEK
jgi:hypothetical protein